MIKVEKDFTDIPNILTKNSRKEAFDNNISSATYCDDKNRYKVKSIQKRLKEIYHLKCAYCEKKLLDTSKHIEHYRPKSIYYWLAYSWDNLLLCCESCNRAKGNRFDTKNSKVKYGGETFDDIHNLGDSYDRVEEPMIINPEKDDVLELIVFDKDGKIDSEDERVKYTIKKACKLNREELVELRLEIITDFINRLNKHYLYFLEHKDISMFKPDVESFIDNCRKENEFYAFRYFVMNNIEIFFEENKPLQKIVKGLFEKLS